MKRYISTLVLLAALALPATYSTASASSPDVPLIAYSVRSVHLDENGTVLAKGASQLTVLRLLGSSYRKMPNDVWLYQGFTPSDPVAKEQGCNQLMISFSEGRIAGFTLVNRKTAVLVAKGAEIKPAASVVISR